MGRPSATDAEVEQAAEQSGCDAFIRGLDNGYEDVYKRQVPGWGLRRGRMGET